jgi:hypothetical protein
MMVQCEAILLRFAQKSDFAASHYLDRDKRRGDPFSSRQVYGTH